MLSMSTRRHEYGRTTRDEATQGGWFQRGEEGDSGSDENFSSLQGLTLSHAHDDDSASAEGDADDEDGNEDDVDVAQDKHH